MPEQVAAVDGGRALRSRSNALGPPPLSSLGRSTMRNTVSILFISATVLVGCHSPSPVHTQATEPSPFQPMLITSLGGGTNAVSDDTWRIAVSETSLYLSRLGPGGTIGVPLWTARTGWFVFIESDSRVWASDGVHPLWLSTLTRNGNGAMWTNYVSPRFPCAVPSEVYSRLSEPAQKAISSHD